MIIGEKVILRPFKPTDLPAIEECLTDPEVIKLTGSDDDYDQDVVVDWYNTRNEQSDRLDLAIVDQKSGKLVGEAVVNLYDAEKHSMNYRILIGPRGRDRGLGTEATQLMVNFIFRNTDLKQLTLNVFAFNPRAQMKREDLYWKVSMRMSWSMKEDGLIRIIWS